MALFRHPSRRELIAAKKIRKKLIEDGIPEADIATIEALGPTDSFVPPDDADIEYQREIRRCISEYINNYINQ